MVMKLLTPDERRALRAKAHHLHPVVSVGQQGLTPAVLHEIDVNLLAHELIKVRVFSNQRHERDALLQRICAELDAAPVQHIGKLLVVWRPAPQEVSPDPSQRPAGKRDRPGRTKPRRPAPGAIQGTARWAAKRAPQVRHPRVPTARTPARPASGLRPRGARPAPATGGRRRRGV